MKNDDCSSSFVKCRVITAGHHCKINNDDCRSYFNKSRKMTTDNDLLLNEYCL